MGKLERLKQLPILGPVDSAKASADGDIGHDIRRDAAHFHGLVLMVSHMMIKTLRQLREDRGRSPEELAKVAGITRESYYDLEMHEGELDNNISVRSVAQIARELGVPPSSLYGGTSGGVLSAKDLAALVRQHLARSGQSLAQIEDQIGFTIGAALVDPDQFGDFNADGLRAVTTSINVNWLDVLDHLL